MILAVATRQPKNGNGVAVYLHLTTYQGWGWHALDSPITASSAWLIPS